jgi:hypothetical protein
LGCGYDLSVDAGDDGRLLVYCFGRCKFEDIVAAAAEIEPPADGDDDGDAGDDGHDVVVAPRASDQERIDDARRRYVRLILTPAAGTIAEVYLRRRGLTRPLPPVLQFGICPHRRGGNFPALVAAITGVDGRQTGFHLTFLKPDGASKAAFPDRKDQRESRGVLHGGMVRFAEHDPRCALIIGEGLETTLSAMEIFDRPGWSAVSAAGLATVTLPSMVRRVIIAADNDISGAGQRVALAAYHRLIDEGREARIAMPPIAGTDFNDVLKGKADGRSARQ